MTGSGEDAMTTAPTALVYGGSGSGKSECAERMLLALKSRGMPPVYIATMRPEGAEARERIARHRAARAHKGFATVERYTDLASLEIPAGAAVLLECLGNLLANEFFSPGGAGAAGKAARDAVLRGLESLARRAARLIVVSNDVFSDGVEYPAETKRYIGALADLNRTIADGSALVIESVCGIPLRRKDDGAWDA